jgi:hypothetical protein
MNIFVTSPSALIASRDLDDVRLRKMILETAQMCATAFREGWNINTTYKSSHKNHPCNVWARKTPANLYWLIDYGLLLHEEYKFRWPGKTHKSGHELKELDRVYIDCFEDLHSCEETPFANCARRTDQGIDFTHIPNVHEAYRLYLNARWALDKRQPKWTRRGPPDWLEETLKQKALENA